MSLPDAPPWGPRHKWGYAPYWIGKRAGKWTVARLGIHGEPALCVWAIDGLPAHDVAVAAMDRHAENYQVTQ